jgi:hypothetical protein
MPQINFRVSEETKANYEKVRKYLAKKSLVSEDAPMKDVFEALISTFLAQEERERKSNNLRAQAKINVERKEQKMERLEGLKKRVSALCKAQQSQPERTKFFINASFVRTQLSLQFQIAKDLFAMPEVEAMVEASNKKAKATKSDNYKFRNYPNKDESGRLDFLSHI